MAMPVWPSSFGDTFVYCGQWTPGGLLVIGKVKLSQGRMSLVVNRPVLLQIFVWLHAWAPSTTSPQSHCTWCPSTSPRLLLCLCMGEKIWSSALLQRTSSTGMLEMRPDALPWWMCDGASLLHPWGGGQIHRRP